VTARPKLLLSSVCKPFGPKHGDGFSTRPSALWQNTWVQGAFIPETVDFHWGLDLIAKNLETPTKVLHYPSMARFVLELKRHRYDYVGLSFNECTFHKMEPMARAVRTHSPHSKIILGGYGTTLPDEEIGHLGDHICREEAIGFMRRLLGEPDRPFQHPLVTVDNWLFSLPLLGKTGMIAAGLGCPNGCDFCLTSHYFKRKHIAYLPTGQAIVDLMQRHRQLRPDLNAFCIYDEDLLLFKRRGREFLEAMRKTDFVPQITIFTSMKALSFYEPSELAEMGIGSIWIGFEGKRAGYDKMEGAKGFAETIAELKTYGIHVVLCMIIGFDYQTADTIREELAEFIACKPTLAQFMIYGPSGGTPLLRRLAEEGRLNDRYQNKALREGYSLCFDHPHIGADEMEELLRECYRTEYEANGPSIYRYMDGFLQCYLHLKDSDDWRLRERAMQCRDFVRFSWGAYDAGLSFAPNDEVRRRIADLYEQVVHHIGPPSLKDKALSRLGRAAARLTDYRYKKEILMQPRTRVARYNWFGRPDTL
jgi:haloalkane dehalogenase